MGLGVKLRNFIHSIFGKKTNGKDSVITKEVKRRAQELGISPEDYIKITQENGSVWNTGNNEHSYSNRAVDSSSEQDDTVQTLRSNLQKKKLAYGITDNTEKPVFGILTSVLGNVQNVINDSDKANELKDATEDYQEAVEDVQKTKDEGKENVQRTENFFTQTSREADLNNDEAESEEQKANRIATQNNTDANKQLEQTKTDAEKNKQAALDEQTQTENQVQQNNDEAQKKQVQAEEKRTQDNNAAQQKTKTEEENKNKTESSVQTTEQQLQNANTEVSKLQNLLNGAKEEEKADIQSKLNSAIKKRDELKAQLDKAKKEDDKAKQSLDEAKNNQSQVERNGDNAVKDATDNTERVKEEGDRTKTEAVEHTQKVEQNGKGKIQQEQQTVDQVEQDGKKSVEESKKNTDEVRKQGEKDVDAAQKDVKETKDKEKKDNITAEQEADYAQREKMELEEAIYNSDNSLGVVTENSGQSKPEGELWGNKARKDIETKVREKYPNASEKEIEQRTNAALQKSMSKIDEKRKAEAQYCFENPPSKAEMQKIIDARYQQETAAGNTTKSNDRTDMPNDDMNDKVAQQISGNCWAHGAINSLSATKEGEKMLLDHMHRDEQKGVTAVHLQEAENNGMGTGGTGIYTFTDKEIAEGARRFSTGDGNVTAYMLATEQYMKEHGEGKKGKRYASDSNLDSRMYQMITGAPVRYPQNTQYVNIGLNQILNNAQDSNMTDYNVLCDVIRSGHASASMTVATHDKKSGHVFSVVGVSESGKLLVQESNQLGTLSSMYTYIDKNGNRVAPFVKTKSINGSPTYELSKENYYKFIRNAAIYRWK